MPLANARYGVTNSDTLDRWKTSGKCARGASNDDFGRVLAFYTVGVPCWMLIGCSASVAGR